MSTQYKGGQYANTQASPIEQIDEGLYNVPVMKIMDSFVLTLDLAANDTILMGGPIPEGAILDNAKLIAPTGLGGSAAFNFGYQAGATALAGAPAAQAVNLTAFFSALPMSSATYAAAFASSYQGTYYTQVALTSQVQPIITCTVATSGATGDTIYVEISYTKSGG